VVGVDAVGRERWEHVVVVVVGTDLAEHRRVRAGVGRRDGLIRALAAVPDLVGVDREVVRKGVDPDGVPAFWEPVVALRERREFGVGHADDVIDVDAAEADDAIHRSAVAGGSHLYVRVGTGRPARLSAVVRGVDGYRTGKGFEEQ